MAKPNTLNLDGIFAQLANVVWTNYGPFAVEDFTLRKADVERASTEAALASPPRPDCLPQLLPPLSTCSVWISSRA